jgi:hypothetical protein
MLKRLCYNIIVCIHKKYFNYFVAPFCRQSVFVLKHFAAKNVILL